MYSHSYPSWAFGSSGQVNPIRFERDRPAPAPDRVVWYLHSPLEIAFRAKLADKRGGDSERVALEDAISLSSEPNVDLLAVDEALNELSEFDEQQSRIVELRFFDGLTIDETAHVVGISPATVKREWSMAKAWLHRKLRT